MSRRRSLSGEDTELWNLVRNTAVPLHPEPPKPVSPPPQVPSPPAKRDKATKPQAAPPPLPKPTKAAPSPPPGLLDRRTRSRLSRGILDVDARLDLHGLTQSLAHRRLRSFIEGAQADGAKLVLVISGKGGPGGLGDFTEPVRGVLRRAVPEWLRSREFEPLVAGFDEAGRRHGGGGAIYVRIRKKRPS
jgi:DNA-nicking Smr family endonuclease